MLSQENANENIEDILSKLLSDSDLTEQEIEIAAQYFQSLEETIPQRILAAKDETLKEKGMELVEFKSDAKKYIGSLVKSESLKRYTLPSTVEGFTVRVSLGFIAFCLLFAGYGEMAYRINERVNVPLEVSNLNLIVQSNREPMLNEIYLQQEAAKIQAYQYQQQNQGLIQRVSTLFSY